VVLHTAAGPADLAADFIRILRAGDSLVPQKYGSIPAGLPIEKK